VDREGKIAYVGWDLNELLNRLGTALSKEK
jgi:hypothetical protein